MTLEPTESSSRLSKEGCQKGPPVRIHSLKIPLGETAKCQRLGGPFKEPGLHATEKGKGTKRS